MYTVYQITCTCCNKNYIGSTKATLETRLKRHIYSSRLGSQTQFHRHIAGFDLQRNIPDKVLVITPLMTGLGLSEARTFENDYIVSTSSVINGLNSRYQSIMCQHKIKRAKCTPCGGSQSRCVEHNTIRYQCNKGDCQDRATNICEHNTQRPQCSICVPYKCEWCEAKLTRSGYTAHMATHKHKQALTPNLGWLFGDD